MAATKNVLISSIGNVADSIRDKTEIPDNMTLSEMPGKVDAIKGYDFGYYEYLNVVVGSGHSNVSHTGNYTHTFPQPIEPGKCVFLALFRTTKDYYACGAIKTIAGKEAMKSFPNNGKVTGYAVNSTSFYMDTLCPASAKLYLDSITACGI